MHPKEGALERGLRLLSQSPFLRRDELDALLQDFVDHDAGRASIAPAVPAPVPAVASPAVPIQGSAAREPSMAAEGSEDPRRGAPAESDERPPDLSPRVVEELWRFEGELRHVQSLHRMESVRGPLVRAFETLLALFLWPSHRARERRAAHALDASLTSLTLAQRARDALGLAVDALSDAPSPVNEDPARHALRTRVRSVLDAMRCVESIHSDVKLLEAELTRRSAAAGHERNAAAEGARTPTNVVLQGRRTSVSRPQGKGLAFPNAGGQALAPERAQAAGAAARAGRNTKSGGTGRGAPITSSHDRGRLDAEPTCAHGVPAAVDPAKASPQGNATTRRFIDGLLRRAMGDMAMPALPHQAPVSPPSKETRPQSPPRGEGRR